MPVPAAARMALHAGRQVGRQSVEVVVRQHPARASEARQRPVIGAPFHIDELRAELNGLAEDPQAFLLAPVKRAALPRRPAGDDDWFRPAFEGAGHRDVGHPVEAQLDQIGGRRAIARPPQFRHRGRRHRFTDACHAPKCKKPLQRLLKRPSNPRASGPELARADLSSAAGVPPPRPVRGDGRAETDDGHEERKTNRTAPSASNSKSSLAP